MDIIAVYITTENAVQAGTIGRTLVEERLVACVNILDHAQSIYRWEGAICENTETILIAKTQRCRLDALVERVKELHTYSCPCIAALPVVGGNNEFLNWIISETAD
jgi:periplasmic divalent cation tolerance protein